MTDGETQEIEPGSALPVPAELDGNSADEAASSHGSEVENTVDNRDLFAVDSNGNRDLDESADIDWPELAITEPVSTCPVEGDTPLSEAEAQVLDSMVNQAMLSSQLNDGLSFPWETGVMASIFGDEPLASMPSIPCLAHNMDGRRDPSDRGFVEDSEPTAKRQRVNNSILKCYERAIRFRNNLSDHEADEIKWNRALEKLYAVVISSPGVVRRTHGPQSETAEGTLWFPQSKHGVEESFQFGEFLLMAQNLFLP